MNGMPYRSIIHRGQLAIKGVVYHHRGAYLLARKCADNIMGKHAVYLWTLPMFHCNGWCFHGPYRPSPERVCLRQVRDEPIWDALAHICDAFGGAPIVMSLIIAAGDSVKRKLSHLHFTAAARRRNRCGRYETGRV